MSYAQNGEISPETLNDSILGWVARGSVGGSTLRGAGARGVNDAVRASLRRINLDRFTDARSEAEFAHELNHVTRVVRRNLPRGAKRWGTARKPVNIFLRGAFYNSYVADEFDLHHLEPWLELPLDSYTSKEMRDRYPDLPSFPGVHKLTWRINADYQAAAAEYANACGVARVHLDAEWWGNR